MCKVFVNLQCHCQRHQLQANDHASICRNYRPPDALDWLRRLGGPEQSAQEEEEEEEEEEKKFSVSAEARGKTPLIFITASPFVGVLFDLLQGSSW